MKESMALITRPTRPVFPKAPQDLFQVPHVVYPEPGSDPSRVGSRDQQLFERRHPGSGDDVPEGR